MVEYPIIVVMWEDHVTRISSPILQNPDEAVSIPTITVGFLLTETDKTYLVAHDIERQEEWDDGTYTVIIKAAVLSIKTYGSISLNEIRFT